MLRGGGGGGGDSEGMPRPSQASSSKKMRETDSEQKLRIVSFVIQRAGVLWSRSPGWEHEPATTQSQSVDKRLHTAALWTCSTTSSRVTASHPNSEVKLGRVWVVLPSGTGWEGQMLHVLFGPPKKARAAPRRNRARKARGSRVRDTVTSVRLGATPRDRRLAGRVGARVSSA